MDYREKLNLVWVWRAIDDYILCEQTKWNVKSDLPSGLKIKLPTIQKTIQKSKLKVWEQMQPDFIVDKCESIKELYHCPLPMNQKQ